MYADKGKTGIESIEMHAERELRGLVQYHIIQVCSEINTIQLPQQILKYEATHAGNIDLKTMITDYLELEKERIVYYTDFIVMPSDKLKNAAMNFLHAARNEKIYFITDQSLMGNNKEGFAMTEFGIYWKMPMQKPQKVYYHQLNQLVKDGEWMTINKQFFHANPTLNTKLLFLLDKLRAIYAE
jgi:hypothetical protein